MAASRTVNGLLKNSSGERIDFVVEGNLNAPVTIVFVHGFGTNKNEGFNLFVDLAQPFLEKYRIVRFDFSGYGNSEGKQEDVNLTKQASDLKAVLDYVKSNYNGGICVIAFSMGCSVVSSLGPEGIEKTIFVSPPSSDTATSIESLKRRILSRPGGVVEENGISIYPRTSRQVQKVGSLYWKALRKFDPISAITKYSKKTKLVVIRPIEDDVVIGNVAKPYQNVSSLRYVELHGNHGFTKTSDRELLIKEVKDIIPV